MMPSESMSPTGSGVDQMFLNTDGSPATWVTHRSQQERIKGAAKRTLIGGLLSLAAWVLQYSNGVLGINWPNGLWPLGIGAAFGFFSFINKEVRHYSTEYVTYTQKQRLARAWKWWAIPVAMCLTVLVVLHLSDQLSDHWMNGIYMLVFSIPGFGLYMLKRERVLTPGAANAKSEIEAAQAKAQKNGTKKSPLEEALEAALGIVWVRYPLAFGCFWAAYWMGNQDYKQPYLGVIAALVLVGFGMYFAREVSKWVLGIAVVGLILWAVFAGAAALTTPMAIIIGALIIAGAVSNK